MQLILVIVSIVFLFGLIQWARSGAVLWDILRLSRYGAPGAANTAETEETEKPGGKDLLLKSIKKMETTMDGLLLSSFKVLGILALGVWVFVVASVVMDMFGLNWTNRLSFSGNRVVGNPTVRAGYNNSRSENSGRRNEALRTMGSSMRRQDGNRR